MVVILMGVSGSGKTTIGIRLAADLGWRFMEADDLHSPACVRKLEAGEALSADDLRGWMVTLRGQVADLLARGHNVVLAFSALNNGARSELTVDPAGVRFVYLKGTVDLVRQRLRARSGHYLSASVLASQFATLEEPRDAVTIDIDERPGRIVERIREALAL